MQVDLPVEGDPPRAQPEIRASDKPPIVVQEPSDRVALAADYQATVDATYRDYQAVTPEVADRSTHESGFRGAPDAEEGGERRAYLVQFRALVEAEYEDAGRSRNTDRPALLHADADPLRAFGPASETHPVELEEAMARLDRAGVEVDMRRGAMSYSPSAGAGQPGRLILDPEASYGAVLHEMSHFTDDETAGFPGLRYWLEDPAVTAAGESRAYQTEIEYANSLSDPDIASHLEELKAQRISQLLGENDE